VKIERIDVQYELVRVDKDDVTGLYVYVRVRERVLIAVDEEKKRGKEEYFIFF